MEINNSALIQYQNQQIRELSGNINSGKKDGKLLQACKDFEALFVKQMLDSMRKTVHKSELTDSGMAEDVFEDMLYDEYAKKMTDTVGFGLANLLYKQFT